jgi:phosphate transport system permease protein
MKQEKLIEGLLKLSGWLSLAITLSVMGVLLYNAAAFFAMVPMWEFITGTAWIPFAERKAFGMWPLLSGTLLTAGIALSLAMPLGILIAIYLSEYASEGWRRIARPALDLLAAIPTVVYGFLALVFITPMLQWFFPSIATYNALSPGLVMAFMVLPIITSISEDAMRAVPKIHKEAALALGATRWQIVRKVVVPAAFNGISAAVILAFSRALGETMIVSIAAGQQASFTFNPAVAIQTASSYIIQMSLGDVAQSSIEYSTIFAIGLSLFFLTYLLNNLSFWFRDRFRSSKIISAA